MRNSLRLGRIFGIELRVDTSWLFIFALVVWSLASLFGRWHPDWSSWTSFFVAAVAALVFFASVLFHELAHSLVARLYRIPVRDITLHMFGGVSNVEREPPTPLAEFLVAVVGPISSVALGVAMIFASSVAFGISGASTANFDSATDAVSHMGPVATLLFCLGPVNIMVGLFNLVPGFPLDGGRILRSILWRITGNLQTATRAAATVGQLTGWAFIIAGGFMAFGYHVPFFGSGFVGGLWLAMIGLFLRNAAAQHYLGAAVAGALTGLHVGDIMRRTGAWVRGDLPIHMLVNDWFLRHQERAYPVFEGSRFEGLVSLDDIRRLPMEEWNHTIVRELMTNVSSLTTAAPEEDLFGALQRLGASSVRQLPVLSNGTLVGMLYEHDVLRWLDLRGSQGGNGRFGRMHHA